MIEAAAFVLALDDPDEEDEERALALVAPSCAPAAVCALYAL